jgi:hypothetical protein
MKFQVIGTETGNFKFDKKMEEVKMLNDIKEHQTYLLLMGDEPYYIDIVSNFIEKKVLRRRERI